MRTDDHGPSTDERPTPGASLFLVQLLLPLRAPDGTALPAEPYARLTAELTARFGGLTAYTRAPAEGLWDDGAERVRDDIVVYEVMADALDRAWWAALRRRLERELRQDELVIRASAAERL